MGSSASVLLVIVGCWDGPGGRESSQPPPAGGKEADWPADPAGQVPPQSGPCACPEPLLRRRHMEILLRRWRPLFNQSG